MAELVLSRIRQLARDKHLRRVFSAPVPLAHKLAYFQRLQVSREQALQAWLEHLDRTLPGLQHSEKKAMLEHSGAYQLAIQVHPMEGWPAAIAIRKKLIEENR